MKKTTIEQLNSAAMQIILHAGDCRNLLNEAVNASWKIKVRRI